MATPFDFRQTSNTATVDFAPAGQSFARPMSPGQRSYLRDLMLRKAAIKGIDLIQADDRLDTWFADLTFDRASREITAANEWLRAQALADPVIPSPPRDVTFGVAALPGADVVPAGRYAIDTRDGAINETAFYKVDRPTEGRWAGKVFVKRLVGPDEQRLSWAVTKTALADIAAAGAQAASARYGHEIGHCGVCGTRLTNDVSREYGIGPDCRKKFGW